MNVQDYRSFTPLMLAAANDHANPEIVQLLLAHGADTQTKDAQGKPHPIGRKVRRHGSDPRAWKYACQPEGRSRERYAVDRAARCPDSSATQRFACWSERRLNSSARAGCFACHEQPAAAFAVGAARAKGITIDEKAASDRWTQLTSGLNASQLEGAAPLGGADNNLYLAEALVRSGYTPDRKTDMLAANLAAYQGGDGGWHLPGYARSPLQDNDFSRTAMAIRALKTYGTPGRAAEMKQRIERAKQWLLHADAVTTEDLDMRLAGVAAAGAPALPICANLPNRFLRASGPTVDSLSATTFASDAYATGMTLWALADAGVIQPSHDVYRKGVRFLLTTQASDGSWHVVSRATKFQIYFEGGFPYGHDQWISIMGTGWATSALSLAIH